MTNAGRIRFIGFVALVVVLFQVAVYVVAWRSARSTVSWFFLDPRFGISAWTDSIDDRFPGVPAWLSVLPLFVVGLLLLRRPSPMTLKVYMTVESALAAPSVAFFALVLYENLSPAHGFSIRELPIPLTVLFLVTVVPLFVAWRVLRMSTNDERAAH